MSQVYYVVDTGILFSPSKIDFKDAMLVTTNNIINEIRNKPSQTRAKFLILLERMENRNPTSEYVNRARAAAIRSGDISVISENDLELIALALMLDEGEGKKIVLVSTDFAVLNIASHMHISILDPSGRFERKITWTMICPACNYKSKTLKRETECPVCGTEMRRSPLKKGKSRESW